jgi:hypothetical protein
LLSKLVAPQEAAAPIAPPMTALPTKIAPPTIIGAIFASDVEEKESSETIIKYIILYFCILNHITVKYPFPLVHKAAANSPYFSFSAPSVKTYCSIKLFP